MSTDERLAIAALADCNVLGVPSVSRVKWATRYVYRLLVKLLLVNVL